VNLATFPARAIILAKPAVVNGAPRSDVITNGEGADRLSSRKARISSPCSGCTLGTPCLTRRTCSTALRPNSTCSQRRSTSSAALKFCGEKPTYASRARAREIEIHGATGAAGRRTRAACPPEGWLLRSWRIVTTFPSRVRHPRARNHIPSVQRKVGPLSDGRARKCRLSHNLEIIAIETP